MSHSLPNWLHAGWISITFQIINSLAHSTPPHFRSEQWHENIFTCLQFSQLFLITTSINFRSYLRYYSSVFYYTHDNDMMVHNQSSATASSGWTSSYTELLSNIKSEPQSFGQYGYQYPQQTQRATALTPQVSCSSSAEDPLDEDLKDIKLEDLCYLSTEVNDFAFHDARMCDQLRSSTSPASYCSSDLECDGSPASSTAESWFSTGSSDHVVPGASPQHTPNFQLKEESPLYHESVPKPTMPQQPATPQSYPAQRMAAAHPNYNYQHPCHYPRYVCHSDSLPLVWKYAFLECFLSHTNCYQYDKFTAIWEVD